MRSKARGMLVGGFTVAIAALAMFALGLGWLGAEAASAHPGHDDGAHEDGRLPGQPDFDRVGKTTYRFNEAREEYEIRHPGRPTAYAHYDHEFEEPEGEGSQVEELAAGAGTYLPPYEEQPICRSSGNRVVVVTTRRPGQTPASSAALISLVKRMTWKILQQSLIASNNTRPLHLVVDCNGNGINVYDVVTADGSLSTVAAAVKPAIFGSPTGQNAVKYLVFDQTAQGGGIAEGMGPDATKSFTNSAAVTTGVAVTYATGWELHVPMHELFHTFGAAKGSAKPPAPYATSAMHCTDGLDILCYDDGTSSTYGWYNETRCPASAGYDQPTGTPLDCKYDTYFNPTPPAGSWLATYWNTGGEENPFLVNPNDVLLKATTSGPTRVGDTTATLRGRVSAAGSLPTSYRFDYGPTTAYGSTSAWTAIAATPSGINGDGAVSGLKPDTTYHYRVVASNSNGTVYGEDQTFKTNIWQQRPTPASVEQGAFEDISCTSRSACTAVGTASQKTLAERWDGEQWTVQATSALSGTNGSALRGVSCAGPSSCVAVGSSSSVLPLAAHWDGSSWSKQPLPAVKDALTTELRDVSCASQSFCVAVGTTRVLTQIATGEFEEEGGEEIIEEWEGTRSVAFLWDGSEWTVTSTPEPSWPPSPVRPEGRPEYQLQGVSCTSTNSCLAVGKVSFQYAPSFALAERWDGGSWSTTQTPLLSYAHFEGVSCSASNSCMAVGRAGGSEYRGLAARWNGSGWTEKSPTGLVSELRSVSCLSSGTCLGLGPSSSAAQGHAMTIWNGSSWSSELLGMTNFGPANSRAIACTSASSCIAVGVKYEPAQSPSALHRLPVVAPTATTDPATALKPTAATLKATVNPEGYATGYQFSYSPPGGPAKTVPLSPAAIGSGVKDLQLEEQLTGLTPATAYTYKIIATSAAGKTEGSSRSFTTLPNAPAATTGAASGIRRTRASVAASVNPNGLATTYTIQYGTTTAYGSSVPAAPKSIGSGESPVAIAETIAGLLPATTYHYRVVATNSGATTNGADRQFATLPAYLSSLGTQGSGKGQLQLPLGVATGPNGNLYVADTLNGRIQKFDSAGESLATFGTQGTGNGQLENPFGLDVDAAGNVWVADTVNNRVVEFDSSGAFVRKIGGTAAGTGPGQFDLPGAVAVDAEGNVWVSDSNNNRLQQFDSAGTFIRQVGTKGKGNGQFEGPVGIAIDAQGHLWVADFYNLRVQELSSTGAYLSQFGSKGSGAGQFESISGLTIDAEGHLWVSDFESCRVKEFDTAGNQLSQLGACGSGPGQLGGLMNGPNLAAGPGGELWIATGGAHRVQKWEPAG